MPARTPIFRTVSLTGSYAPLADTTIVGDFVITALETNAAAAYFQGDDGSDVKAAPKDWYVFKGCDLSAIRMKGTVGDKVTIIGHA